jgi:alanine dehydrogenase
MRRGAALVDISIDQGGCAETSRPTTHADPIYVELGVVHYCVANMPSIVPHTSTYALTNATLSYALELADRGFAPALRASAPLRHACNVLAGEVTHPGVASRNGVMPFSTGVSAASHGVRTCGLFARTARVVNSATRSAVRSFVKRGAFAPSKRPVAT